MSFSVQTKDELARIEERYCCRVAELAALIRLNGRMGSEFGQRILTVGTDNAAVARKVFKCLKDVFDLPARVNVRKRTRLRKNNRYVVRVEGGTDLEKALSRLGLNGMVRGEKTGIKRSLISRDCCRRSYLRGAFLARGSVSNPQSDYHLEILVDTEADAQDLTGVMQKQGLEARITPRKQRSVVYIKGGGQIVDCLNMMGAHSALLEFENARIYKEMRNQVNRLVNCDTANLNKTVRTGVRQEEIIRMLVDRIGMHNIPPTLKTVAELRLQQPDASLRELGEMASPPLSKSCVNHRLRKLEALARRVLADEQH